MQNERTLKFWDKLHQKQPTQEWILHPSISLLRHMADQLPTNRPVLRILEIGCGTSGLAREFYVYLTTQHAKFGEVSVHMWATDASEVCIRQNQERDAAFLQASENMCDADEKHSNSFQYKVLNVTDPHPELDGQFDLILDKGCLDTFAFRSKMRGRGQPHAQLVRIVLDNVQGWLQSGDRDTCDPEENDSSSTGLYLVVTPRPKLKIVRAYKGFLSYQRHELDLMALKLGDLICKQDERNMLSKQDDRTFK